MKPPIVHYVAADTPFVPYLTDPRAAWVASCGVNNQVPKPGTPDPEQVTCLNCLDHLTRPKV